MTLNINFGAYASRRRGSARVINQNKDGCGSKAAILPCSLLHCCATSGVSASRTAPPLSRYRDSCGKKFFLDGHTPGLAPATTTASVKIAVPFGTPAGQVSGKIYCFRYRGVI